MLIMRDAYKYICRETFNEPTIVTPVIDQAHADEKVGEVITDFTLFAMAMVAIRKLWTPQTGAGSSYDLNEAHAYYKAVLDFMTDKMNHFA